MKKAVLILLVLALTVPAFARGVDAIVSVEWLEKNLSKADLVVLDVRAMDAYRSAHIPGAVASPSASWYPKKGELNAEVPELDVLADLIQESGIKADTTVVIVEAEGGARYHVAARVAFTLMYAGLDNIAILDGGFAAWAKAGKPTSAGMEFRDETEYKVVPRPTLIVSEDYVAKNMKKSQFLDARSYDLYFGRTKFAASTQFGHIPGAYATPKEWLYDAEGKLVSKEKILEFLNALKINPKKEVIGYCDTGMGCSIWWWVLSQHLGWSNVKMYDGSSEQLTKNPAVKFVMYTWR